MAEHEDWGRRFFRSRGQPPERTPAMALTWAVGAFLLFVLGLAFGLNWKVYIGVAAWTGVAVVWWVRYRRYRAANPPD